MERSGAKPLCLLPAIVRQVIRQTGALFLLPNPRFPVFLDLSTVVDKPENEDFQCSFLLPQLLPGRLVFAINLLIIHNKVPQSLVFMIPSSQLVKHCRSQCLLENRVR